MYSYLCRHSSGTKYYAELGEALAKKQMLHAPDSKMAKVYNHLASEDLVQGRKKANGIETEKDKVNNGTCWKCKHPNSFGAHICSKCASPLNIQGVEDAKKKETMHRFDIAGLNDEEKAFMREEMRKMAMELAKEMIVEKEKIRQLS